MLHSFPLEFIHVSGSRPPGGLVKVRLLFFFPSKGFQRGQSQRGLKNLRSQQISRGTLRLLSPGGPACGGTLLKIASYRLLRLHCLLDRWFTLRRPQDGCHQELTFSAKPITVPLRVLHPSPTIYCPSLPGVEAEKAKRTEEGWRRLSVASAGSLHYLVNSCPQHVPRGN